MNAYLGSKQNLVNWNGLYSVNIQGMQLGLQKIRSTWARRIFLVQSFSDSYEDIEIAE